MRGGQYIETYFSPESYRQLDIRYNPEQQALWCYMRHPSRPCCTLELFLEMLNLQRAVENYVRDDSDNNLRFFVFASRIPGIFNVGGDLDLLLKLVRTKDRDGLYNYAKSSIDALYTGYHLPVTTISLVQGDAFGGGFEGALVSRVLIAERQVQMGLPETLFNFFPGMAAYSLLARKIGQARAEQMILSGRTYAAQELHEMGVVDVLAESGEGEKAVNAYIKKQNRANNSYQAIHKVRQLIHPLNYDELLQVTKVWLDAAMRMSDRDLRIMERIAQSQEKLVTLQSPVEVKQLA